MPAILRNLANSEKAVALGLLVLAASVLAALGTLSVEQWIDYTKWMAGFYVTGKTLQGAASVLGSAKTATAAADAIYATAKVEEAKLKAVISSNDAAADKAAESLP